MDQQDQPEVAPCCTVDSPQVLQCDVSPLTTGQANTPLHSYDWRSDQITQLYKYDTSLLFIGLLFGRQFLNFKT